MTGARVGAALAAMATALLVQGALVVPLAGPVPVSLPAVLVAAVALAGGPGPGMAFGFATGLVADLASTHPAGVLALSWLALGLVCGTLAAPIAGARPVRVDAALAAGGAALAGLAAVGILGLVHTATVGSPGAVADAALAALGEALLALAVVPLTRWFGARVVAPGV